MVRRWAMSILLCLSAARAGAALLSLEVVPAWEGRWHPGATTELAVRLLSDTRGTALLTVPEHNPPIRINGDVQPNEPVYLHLPVRPPVAGRLIVEARVDSGAPSRVEVAFDVPPGQPIIPFLPDAAKGTDTRSSFGMDTNGIFRPRASALPRSAEAYEAIDVLALGGAAIAALDSAQLAALHAYLANCGKAVLVAADRHQFSKLSISAGCGGRMFSRVSTAEELDEHIATLIDASASPLPGMAALRALSADTAVSNAAWQPLAAFCLFYFISVLVVARSARRPMALLAIPPIAAAIGFFAWSGSTPERHLVSWTEMDSGSQTARFSALLSIVGRGRAETVTTLPSTLGLPRPLSEQSQLELRYDGFLPGMIQLAHETRLLSRRLVLLEGTTSVQTPLRLTLIGDVPAVVNTGTQPAPAGLVGWQGRRYRLPTLMPGGRWQPQEDTTDWDVGSSIERMLRERSQGEVPALLVPFEPEMASLLTPEVEVRGWLLIRAS